MLTIIVTIYLLTCIWAAAGMGKFAEEEVPTISLMLVALIWPLLLIWYVINKLQSKLP